MVLFGSVVQNILRPLITIRERNANPEEILRSNNDNLSASIRSMMPAKVVSFNATKQTIVAQPLIREKIVDRASGQVKFVQLPQLVDIPVCFPQAGNFVLTMPIKAGDEVILSFADMCIDSWWASGGVQNWNDRRRHDISDAIALIGVNSVPNVIENISLDATELRTKNGENKLQIKDDSVLLERDGKKVEIDDDKLKLTFGSTSIEIDGTNVKIVGTLKINGVNYMSHVHSGVTPGPAPTGPVVL